MTKNTALIAGGLGIAGRALIEELEQRPDWDVAAISRRAPDFPSRANFVSADLLDSRACRDSLHGLSNVTHIFYVAHSARATSAEEVGPNLAMLCNLVEAVELASPSLKHVHLLHGSKWYGNHLGPYRTPAKEDDPRHMPPNFYYNQQDWIEARQRSKGWNWSSLRPHGFCGISIGSPMNHLLGLALYASISRELGLPLRFPGSPGAFRAIYQFTDAALLARAMVWASTTTACANQAFNMTNGEYERWENIWPSIARLFGMQPADVQTISLARFMADKEPLWARMQEKYGLQKYPLGELVNWQFIDWSYSNGFDQMSSLGKARKAGWSETLDAETMFTRLITQLSDQRIIPPLPQATKRQVLSP